jgi:hypothetical protein
MISCKSATCERQIDGGFYCPSCDGQLESRSTKAGREIVKAAAEIYVGRTSYPERRNLEILGGDLELPLLSVLYWANGLENADRADAALLRFLRSVSRKVVNRDDDDGADGPYSGHFHAIYVAWAPKHGAALDAFALLKDSASDPGQRVWPVQFPHFKAIHLMSSLSPEGARALAVELVFRQKEYYAKTRKR